MEILEAFAVALEALRAHKLRSFLTMLGVIIGVAAVIALVSVGQTVQSSVVGEFAELGPDLLWVFPGKADEGGPVPTAEGRLTLTYDDARAISRGAPSVSDVTPFLQTSIEVAAGGEKAVTTVIGTTPNLLTVRSMRMQHGRFLQEADLVRRNRVAVIGETLARALYRLPSRAVGRTLTIGGRAFDVVGVLAPEGSMLGVDLDDRAYLPLTTAQQLFNINYASFLFVKARDVGSVARALRETQRILLREHGDEDFTVLTQSQLLGSLIAILRILTVALTSIGAISLLVGGIGIMNIMLVSVTERTREIGIRKAVGARRMDILTQFLIEAMGISLIGGILGTAVGLGIAWTLSNALFESQPSLAATIPIVVLAFSFSTLVGVAFGVYPAWRAAGLHPIEALRYE